MTAARSGNGSTDIWRALFAAALLCLAAPSAAELSAQLDRYTVRLGETAKLVISSDGSVDPAEADLRALSEDFEILQRSSSVSTEIINGKREQTRKLVLEISPRREGQLVILPFQVDGERSEALSVSVSPALELSAGDEVVLFDVEVDREEVYVQGQLLLTLRIQQAVNLESRSITELQVDGAFVKSLGQTSYQRTVDGRPWLVHEIRYALFPEASGELRIPQQTFSGRLASGRRSLFDTRSSGQLVRRRSEELAITVQPRPDSFTAPVWLPAADLTIEEQWSDAGSDVRVGDSITRNVTVSGTGLQGAQLPPVRMQASEGLRVYPDQPVINDLEGAQGLTGMRTDSLALVAVRPGEYTVPPVTIRWWDTDADAPREATLPSRTLQVLPAVAGRPETPGTTDLPATAEAASSGSGGPADAAGPWPWIAGICALGWVITTGLLWRRSRPTARAVPETATAASARKALLKACAAGDPHGARGRLRDWLLQRGVRQPLSDWARAQDNGALLAAVEDLEARLYSADKQSAAWNGSQLAAAIRALPGKNAATDSAPGALPPLYPPGSTSP